MTIQLLVYQVRCYAIWRERKNRFHSRDISTPTTIANHCMQIVKCKIMSSRWFEIVCERNASLLVMHTSLAQGRRQFTTKLFNMKHKMKPECITADHKVEDYISLEMNQNHPITLQWVFS